MEYYSKQDSNSLSTTHSRPSNSRHGSNAARHFINWLFAAPSQFEFETPDLDQRMEAKIRSPGTHESAISLQMGGCTLWMGCT